MKTWSEEVIGIAKDASTQDFVEYGKTGIAFSMEREIAEFFRRTLEPLYADALLLIETGCN
jgi:hypothetical protein